MIMLFHCCFTFLRFPFLIYITNFSLRSSFFAWGFFFDRLTHDGTLQRHTWCRSNMSFTKNFLIRRLDTPPSCHKVFPNTTSSRLITFLYYLWQMISQIVFKTEYLSSLHIKSYHFYLIETSQQVGYHKL